MDQVGTCLQEGSRRKGKDVELCIKRPHLDILPLPPAGHPKSVTWKRENNSPVGLSLANMRLWTLGHAPEVRRLALQAAESEMCKKLGFFLAEPGDLAEQQRPLGNL